MGRGGVLCLDATDSSAPVTALSLTAVLLIARLALRRDRPAWVALLLTTFALHLWVAIFEQPWSSAAPLVPVINAAVAAAAIVALMAREGLLGRSPSTR